MKHFDIPRNALLFTLALFALTGCNTKARSTAYEFTQVSRGTLEKIVSSTGTLNPVATVKVLSRMNGKVEKIYADFNDPVVRGQVLAELNTDMLRLQREQQLAQVVKARANYAIQELNYQNQMRLAEKNLISEYELNSGKTSLDIQAAELSAAEASLKAIETEINQYAYITSPIDGIVLDRSITEGDTVVDSSSSNSSAIFTLAENLREMQIESWVGELDIAAIQEGQEVRFTLESLPGKNYRGTAASKRLLPSVQDNVVSYKVIVSVDNTDGSLLPGMTCAVEFIEERNEDVLLVSNAALRFRPAALSDTEIEELVFNASLAGMNGDRRAAALERRAASRTQTASSGGDGSQTGLTGLLTSGMGGPGMGGRMPPGGMPGGGPGRQGGGTNARNTTGGGTNAGMEAPAPKSLWYLDENSRPAVILVYAGISDGSRTEIRPLNPAEKLEGTNIIHRERID
ncbi:MAG: efflux RND transporter periplasmic adaptor subunit [Treponema sp.]|jgi:HlyD family secretion protein|nr:efflux RND transporter periplasmic adaptor subunit [Treponema sp.]